MVQFKRERYDPRPSGLDGANEYWKLGEPRNLELNARRLRERLKPSAYYFHSSAAKPRLLQLYSRRERGLLSYEAYKIAELRVFCRQRNVQLARNMKKVEIVSVLEREDENATFDRFLDLPAELRNHVYSLHFGTLEIKSPSIPPPITSVSRQLRQESLALFFSTCTPTFVFPTRRHLRGYWGARLTKLQIQPGYLTSKFFLRAPQTYVGNIRKFHLRSVVCPAGFWVVTTWYVEIEAGSKQVNVSTGRVKCHPRNIPQGFDAAREGLEVRIKAELEAVVARECCLRLSKSGLRTVARLFEQA